jgi:hypothetical protein
MSKKKILKKRPAKVKKYTVSDNDISIGKARRNYVKEFLDKKILPVLSDNEKLLIGTWIRSFHFMAPFGIIAVYLFFPKHLVTIGIILMLLITGSFIYFRGCVLSVLEERLLGNDINIVDGLLLLLNKEINGKNRYQISMIIAVTFITFNICVYYCRFYSSTNFSEKVIELVKLLLT